METGTHKQRFIGKDPRADATIVAHDDALMFPTYRLNFSDFLPRSKQAKILDFGAGYGTFLRYLKNEGYQSARGVDADPRCADFCRSQGLNVVHSEDTLEYLRAHTESFDFVAVLSVLNYFERERTLVWFEALAKSLVPGGVLAIEVANAASYAGRTDFIQDPFMKSEYTDVALEQYLTGAGLTIVKLEDLRIPSKGFRRFLWLTLQKVWHKSLKFIYLLERGRCDRNPRFFSKRLLVIARRPGDLH